MHQRGRPARILLVEDSVADAKLFRIALEEGGSATRVTLAEDGAEALDLLDSVAAGRHLRPDVVVTDLNLPRASGIDVLRRVRVDPTLRTIPVVVFSTSRADVDIATAYDCGASSYVVKPLDTARFGEVVRSIDDYWTATVRLP